MEGTVTIFWRILLASSLASLGLMAGATIGARYFVTRADGLVGGAMVLWYGVLGAVIFLVAGIILGAKFRRSVLRVTALALTGLSITLYGLASYRSISMENARLGSDSAYEAVGEFTATMERLDTSDPYLFVRMDIDSHKRTWTQTGPAPDHDVYFARMSAKSLEEIRVVLEKVAMMKAEDLADCNDDNGPATKRLQWDLSGAINLPNGQGLARKGAVDINNSCLGKHPVIARALHRVENASMAPGGTVKRK